MTAAADDRDWRSRAAAAEKATISRQLRGLTPGAAIGVVGWPAGVQDRLFWRWHYWWQAHLLDCLIDAQLRDPGRRRLVQIRHLIRGILLRNGFHWTNSYFDDISWFGLAIQRAEKFDLIKPSAAVPKILARLHTGWNPARGGGISWNTRGDYFNVPTNGPAGILYARAGLMQRALEVDQWLLQRLLDPETGLFFDGVGADEAAILNRDIYTYCQGVVTGLQVELIALRVREPRAVRELIRAVADHLSVDGVLIGHGGGNGGLFAGITVRYLALAANELFQRDRETALFARDLVLACAEAVWAGRRVLADGPLFAAEWSLPAGAVSRRGRGRKTKDGAESSRQPERDLSVQLGAWMTLEAAASLRI